MDEGDARRMSELSPAEVAQFFFDRPTEPEFNWNELDEQRLWVVGDVRRYLETLTMFFESFVQLAEPYEFRQVEKGVRGLSAGNLFSLGWAIEQSRVQHLELLPKLLEAMKPMFLEYLANAKFEEEHGFFMWWDYMGDHFYLGGWDREGAIADTHLEVLSEILASNDDYCQVCALHGLGHLEHPRREEVVDGFIERLKANGELDEWDPDWIQECRDGTVL